MTVLNRLAPFAAVAALSALGACGANAGGDTTCGDYVAASGSERTAIIKSFLESKGEDPSNGAILLTKGSALAYCKTAGSNSDPISNVDG